MGVDENAMREERCPLLELHPLLHSAALSRHTRLKSTHPHFARVKSQHNWWAQIDLGSEVRIDENAIRDERRPLLEPVERRPIQRLGFEGNFIQLGS